MKRKIVVACVALLTLGACGTRVEEPPLGSSSQTTAPANQVASPQQSGLALPTDATPASGSESRTSATPIGGNDRRNSQAPVGGPTAHASSPGSRPAASSTTRPSQTRPTDSRPPAASAPGPKGPVPVPAGEPGTRSPVVVATIGTMSGPAASALLGVVQGAQLWVKWINAHGGVQGHQVRQILLDDGGDPARNRAVAQEAIEKRGVVAFLASPIAVTGQASVDYITAKGVPVIGSDGGGDWFYTSPMFFPHTVHGSVLGIAGGSSAAKQLLAESKKKFGVLFCVETSACENYTKTFEQTSTSAGMSQVFRSKMSLAQPDFTAECLSARNAKADAVVLVMDPNSVGRASASCARQNYHPVYILIYVSTPDRFKDDPNLDGAIIPTPVFPWFKPYSPATIEFQDAFRSFGKGLSISGNIASGWVAGKLLERAAIKITEPPSSQSLLSGLWSIRNDTLGGLTIPLTFEENKPAARLACWFNVRVKSGAWVSPDGFLQHCI